MESDWCGMLRRISDVQVAMRDMEADGAVSGPLSLLIGAFDVN